MTTTKRRKGMKTEDLIQTPESRRMKRRSAFNRAQYFCLGVAAASFAGFADPWWKSWQTAALFFVLFLVVGACKTISCRVPRRAHVAEMTVVVTKRAARAVTG
jgi:hypothetical protein